MVGAFHPVIKENIEEDEEKDVLSTYVDYTNKLELRIKELESMLETLSPGVTRG